MTPTQIDREMTRLAGKLIDGTITDKELNDYHYLSALRANGLVNLPSLEEIKHSLRR